MHQEKMGQFIAELRKSKQMTQKDLAAQLNITDKAVSKWERGLSCPDIALLPNVATALGVTISELLNGQWDSLVDVEVVVDNALQYADTAVKSKTRNVRRISAAVFSLLLLVGIVVCAICDMALTGGFTWSLFPISSAVFAWLVLFPALQFGRRGLLGAMLAASVLIFPYLWILDHLTGSYPLFLPIGFRMASIAVALLWAIYGLFHVLKTRKTLAAALSFLLLIPTDLLVNRSLSHLLGGPQMDIWDILGIFIVAVVAGALLIIDFSKQTKRS